MVTFNDLVPDERLLKAITERGFTEPTEIQVQAIPPAYQGNDLIGQAKTGSGKTLAFGVPLLHRLTPERRPQALILAPTRELCQQIAVELAKLARYTPVKIAAVFGGVAINPQIAAFRDSQVIIATPGRLLDHLERGTFRTDGVRFLVFDEADRMFDMGFIKDMERIVRRLPKERQTLLFSATMPPEIKRLASQYQRDPVHVKVHTHVEEHLLPQFFYRVDQAGKFSLLVHLLKTEDPALAIIFCPTKHGARALARNLQKQGFEADAMHGNLSQNQRDQVILAFKTGKTRFLVATDVAARGLDIKHVTHIFNYNVPNKADDYIHRIGRTARAGASGKAITLVAPDETGAWRDILRIPHVIPTEIKAEHVPQLSFQKHVRGSEENMPFAHRAPRPAAGRSPFVHAMAPHGQGPHHASGTYSSGPHHGSSEGRSSGQRFQGPGDGRHAGPRPRRFGKRRFTRR